MKRHNQISNILKSPQFNGVGSIATAIGVALSLYLSISKAFFDTPVPILNLVQYDAQRIGGTQEVMFHNSGKALCVNFSIQYPVHFKGKAGFYINYVESSVGKAKWNNDSKKLEVPRRKGEPVINEQCNNNVCTNFVEILGIDEIYVMYFNGKPTGEITSSCVGESKSIKLRRGED